MRWKDGEVKGDNNGRAEARATMTDDVGKVARTFTQCIVLLWRLKNDHDGLG